MVAPSRDRSRRDGDRVSGIEQVELRRFDLLGGGAVEKRRRGVEIAAGGGGDAGWSKRAAAELARIGVVADLQHAAVDVSRMVGEKLVDVTPVHGRAAAVAIFAAKRSGARSLAAGHHVAAAKAAKRRSKPVDGRAKHH